MLFLCAGLISAGTGISLMSLGFSLGKMSFAKFGQQRRAYQLAALEFRIARMDFNPRLESRFAMTGLME
jgi:hypothetical protein